MAAIKNVHVVDEEHVNIKKRKIDPLGVTEQEEIKRLENIVFGKGSAILDDLNDTSDDDVNVTTQSDSVLDIGEVKTPAWIDDDEDVGISFKQAAVKQGRRTKQLHGETKEYQEVLKSRFEAVYGTPKWAEIPKEGETGGVSILQRSGAIIRKSGTLQSGDIEFKQLTELNKQTRTEGSVVKVVKFHPRSTVALVGGLSGIVSLFQVDGKENPKLQSLKFERYPVQCASFLNNGDEFIIGSHMYNHFYCHNLVSGQSSKIESLDAVEITNTKKFVVSADDKLVAVGGKGGYIYLLSSRSKEYIDNLKMNGDVYSLCFNYDGSKLYSHGTAGEVYIWDMKTRQCIHKFIDDGCLTGTSLATSSNNQLLACGSSSGVVNIYETADIENNISPKPLKTINNLVTQVDSLQFNSYSEILSLSSSNKENAVKLCHFPSMTVFKNFPYLNAKFYRPQCSDFSPNSGYYAVANNRGSALLFRLKYYGNY